MKKVIVTPVTGGRLSAHFGHCEEFYFATTQEGKIIEEKMITPPEHEPGLYPKWVKQQGGELVITGGMGPKAVNLFKENGVETIVGAATDEPRRVVEKYLDGTLETSANSCNHH